MEPSIDMPTEADEVQHELSEATSGERVAEPTPEAEATPWLRRSALIDCAALVVVLAGLTFASQIVVPFLMAAFLGILASPLVSFFESKRVPRVIATLGIVSALLGLLTLVSLIVTTSLNTLTKSLPAYRALVMGRIWEAQVWLSGHGVKINVEDVLAFIDFGALFNVTSGLLSGVAGLASNVVLILIVTTFMLIEGASLHEKFENLLERRMRTLPNDPLEQATGQVQRYLVVKSGTSLVTGFLAGILCWSVGLDLALFWGFLAFMFNYIPTIGSIIAALPPILLSFVLLGTGPSVGIFMGYLTLNMVIGNVIEPRLMGRTLGLSPTVILLSMVFWGWLLGPIGALLSAPLTMIVKIVCEHVDEWKWAAHLLDSPVDGLERRVSARLAGAIPAPSLQTNEMPPSSPAGD